MAITKMTADAIKGRPSRRNRAMIEATTEGDIRRQMIEERVRQYAWRSGCDVAELGAEPGSDGARNDCVDAHLGARTRSRSSRAPPLCRVVADCYELYMGSARGDRSGSCLAPAGLPKPIEHVGVVFRSVPGHALADIHVEPSGCERDGLL